MNYFLLKIATIYAYNKSGTIKMSDYKLILIKNVIFIFVIQSKGEWKYSFIFLENELCTIL